MSSAARVTTDQGETWFLKWNPRSPRNMFEAEADGLRALAAARALRVPAVLAVGSGEAAPPWLLLEYVAAGRPGPGYTTALAAGLTALHRTTPDGWGWEREQKVWQGWKADIYRCTGRYNCFADLSSVLLCYIFFRFYSKCKTRYYCCSIYIFSRKLYNPSTLTTINNG